MAVGLAFALAAGGEGASPGRLPRAGDRHTELPGGGRCRCRCASWECRRACVLDRRAVRRGRAAFGILVVLAAAGATPVMPWLLSFSAGAMLYVVMHELIPAAPGRPGIWGFFTGFILMMALDMALG